MPHFLRWASRLARGKNQGNIGLSFHGGSGRISGNTPWNDVPENKQAEINSVNMIRSIGRNLLVATLGLGLAGTSLAHPEVPTDPFEIATRLEARLASGDGVLMPDATREFVRFAGTVDLEIGDWPQEFRSRAGREICVSVSPVTGFYEFSVGTAGTTVQKESPVPSENS